MNTSQEQIKNAALQIASDLMFFASILILRSISSAINSLAGGIHPFSFLGIACFFAWIAWHYIGLLSAEFEVYNRADARKTEQVAGKIFEVFVIVFALFAAGQGFFVFEIIQPLLEPAGLASIALFMRVISFLFLAVSALAGWTGRKKQADGKTMLEWLWVLALTLLVPSMFMPYKPLSILGHGGNSTLHSSDIVLGTILRLGAGLGIPFAFRAGLRFVTARITGLFSKKEADAPEKKSSPWPDMLYSLFVSLVLFFWLKALLDLYIPASLEFEVLFKIEVALLGVLISGPIPIRLVMALRPPLRIPNALVSLALVGWLVFDVWGAVSARQQDWLSEPIDDIRIAALPYHLPHTDSFDIYDAKFWLFYDGNSGKLAAPARPVHDGSLVLRPEYMEFYLSPCFAMPANGVVELARRVKVEADIGSSFYTQLELYLSDSERKLPGINANLQPAVAIQINCMSGLFFGAEGALVYLTGMESGETKLAEMPLGQIVEEQLLWNSKTGDGEYRLDDRVYPFSLKPTVGSVFRVVLKAHGDSPHRLYIDTMHFGL